MPTGRGASRVKGVIQDSEDEGGNCDTCVPDGRRRMGGGGFLRGRPERVGSI